MLDQTAYEGPRAVELVDQLVRWPCSADASAPSRLTDDRRAHRVFLEAGLGPDVANSFLVLAGAQDAALARFTEAEVKAWHFGSDRQRRFLGVKKVRVGDELRLAAAPLPDAARPEQGWLRQVRVAGAGLRRRPHPRAGGARGCGPRGRASRRRPPAMASAPTVARDGRRTRRGRGEPPVPQRPGPPPAPRRPPGREPFQLRGRRARAACTTSTPNGRRRARSTPTSWRRGPSGPSRSTWCTAACSIRGQPRARWTSWPSGSASSARPPPTRGSSRAGRRPSPTSSRRSTAAPPLTCGRSWTPPARPRVSRLPSRGTCPSPVCAGRPESSRPGSRPARRPCPARSRAARLPRVHVVEAQRAPCARSAGRSPGSKLAGTRLGWPGSRGRGVLVLVLVFVSLASCWVFERRGRVPFTSDQAVVAIMAEDILEPRGPPRLLLRRRVRGDPRAALPGPGLRDLRRLPPRLSRCHGRPRDPRGARGLRHRPGSLRRSRGHLRRALPRPGPVLLPLQGADVGRRLRVAPRPLRAQPLADARGGAPFPGIAAGHATLARSRSRPRPRLVGAHPFGVPGRRAGGCGAGGRNAPLALTAVAGAPLFELLRGQRALVGPQPGDGLWQPAVGRDGLGRCHPLRVPGKGPVPGRLEHPPGGPLRLVRSSRPSRARDSWR